MTSHSGRCKAWLLGLAGCIANTTGAPAVWLALLTPFICQASIVDDAYLDRVASIESGGRADAVGRAGELGAYQLKRSAWEDSVRRMFGRIPASYAYTRSNCFDPDKSRTVAREHLRWLEERLSARGITPSKIVLYMSYNMGLTASIRYGNDPKDPRLPQLRASVLSRAESILHR